MKLYNVPRYPPGVGQVVKLLRHTVIFSGSFFSEDNYTTLHYLLRGRQKAIGIEVKSRSVMAGGKPELKRRARAAGIATIEKHLFNWY
jgi:hypothetical protein